MSKSYNLVYIINILLGLIISFIYLFIIRYDLINILFFFLICLFYVFSTTVYRKKKNKIDGADKVAFYLYIFMMMFMFVYNVIYQSSYTAYSFMYYNALIYVYHLLFIIYNVVK